MGLIDGLIVGLVAFGAGKLKAKMTGNTPQQKNANNNIGWICAYCNKVNDNKDTVCVNCHKEKSVKQ